MSGRLPSFFKLASIAFTPPALLRLSRHPVVLTRILMVRKLTHDAAYCFTAATPAVDPSPASMRPVQPWQDSTARKSRSNRHSIFRSRFGAPLSQQGVIPLDSTTLIILAILFSVFFIFTISFAFIGADEDRQPHVKRLFDDVATSNPGIVLFGESVDVDVDEPSVTIRWSILACGEEFILNGSAGAHGSAHCGLPASPLYIFVDGDETPTAMYNPAQIPYNQQTGVRHSISSLVQFDSDHVLDVHEAHLYPFDTYVLSSTLRASSPTNSTSTAVDVPIRKLFAVEEADSFSISVNDAESYVRSTVNGTETPGRDMDMHISRPSGARALTLLLFAVGWTLAHISMGTFIMARRSSERRGVRGYILCAFAVLVALPQLRNSMPDAPGMDGVLIDCIGFFPQMLMSGISAIAMLLLLVARELDAGNSLDSKSPDEAFLPLPSSSPPPKRRPKPISTNRAKFISPLRPITESISAVTTFASGLIGPSPTPHRQNFPLQSPLKPFILGEHTNASSVDYTKQELSRLLRKMNGEYVFPPPSPRAHRTKFSEGVD
ncbi:hypothetical protein PLICRDRAFT_177523 [Plicaturopsis crispa FD-325 SS-3]|nr:hypothetical protein PLICRDRAFT_177523 [Plicaturopsis crispa FD-325 SS-3]